MKYLDISWQHDSEDDPYRMLCEVGADGYEIRKLEFFKNGRIGYASEIESSELTMLSVNRVPKLDAIVAQPGFSGAEISLQQFEQLWQEHVLKRYRDR